MVSWSNWSGRHSVRPEDVHFVRSEDDACGVTRDAQARGQSIRVAGSGHSHSPLVPGNGIIVDSSGLSGIKSHDPQTNRAWIWAGSKIYSLGRPLHDLGLALKNQGDIDRQALAGACATGTHGTGRQLQNLSAAVTGARIALASGELLECSATQNDKIWQASRLSLGSLGITTALEMQLCPAYKLIESGFNTEHDKLVPRIPELVAKHERFEFFWYPGTDQATVKIIDRTDVEARYPVDAEGSRVAWNYEVLPNHRPHFHTEMEYSVPAESGLNCFADIRQLLKRDFPDVVWPVEYRTVAADDVWLSMANGRGTVTISVHQDIKADETAYYQACEEIFLTYGGRPHWGKVNYLDGSQLATAHPDWQAWWAVRDEVDPDGLFLNSYLKSLQPDR